jgi:hypothetical protein
MTPWTSQAVLANVALSDAIEIGCAAFVPTNDPRVQAINEAHPIHATFLERFTDAFAQPIHPTVLLVRSTTPGSYRSVNAMASIRDILSVSVVPRARARHIQRKGINRICFSRTFDFYPWMVGQDHEHLVMSTPAISGFHDINSFMGQVAPEVHCAQMSSSDLDKPLFDALVERWRDFYDDRKPSWDNAKLMRSLNMAYHASQPPADQGTTIFDYGRILALWVSAFEILVHPGEGGRATAKEVLKLLGKDVWINKKCKETGARIYEKIYKCRNDFLHGNPIDVELSQPLMTRDSLFGVSAPLYRMALMAFLDLKCKEPQSSLEDPDSLGREIAEIMDFSDYQKDFETVISQCLASSSEEAG